MRAQIYGKHTTIINNSFTCCLKELKVSRDNKSYVITCVKFPDPRK